ncbi:MAG: hypothetical protein CO029_04020, partial [Candidatus Magasanikbacteria bacterium CG_4_9_14_0_2_um_filter_41_10]
MGKTVIGTNLEKEQIEMNISDLSLRVSIYGILIEDGNVLLANQFGGFDLPGGGLEMGETFAECLEREYWEETGLKVTMGDIVDCKMNFFQFREEQPYQSILIYVTCKKISGELSKDFMTQYEKDGGGDMPEWVPLSTLDDIKLFH